MKLEIDLPRIPDKRVKVTDFGAKANVGISNTKAFQRAMESLRLQGGGHLIVPRGIFSTGPIKLLDKIDLRLEQGAVLLFDKNEEEYPLEIHDFEGVQSIRARSPIYAENVHDISITGKGIINGNGHLWRPCKEWQFTEREWMEKKQTSPLTYFDTEEGELWYPTKSSYEGAKREESLLENGKETEQLKKATPYYDFYRPCMVQLENCKRVLLEGVSFLNSPAWGVHPWFCKHLTIRNCYFKNDDFAQNGDGLDIESCEKVEVCDSLFDTGDDAICIKAGKNREARKIPGPSAHIWIHACRVLNGHGGFVIGSEMSRGVKDVEVEDCEFIGTDTGIRFKSALGRGGCVKNIKLHHIRMIEIKKEAITMNMSYVLYSRTGDNLYDGVMEDEEDIPEFCNIYISDMDVRGAKTGIEINGLENKSIHDVFVGNTSFQCKEEGGLSNVQGICFKDVKFFCDGKEHKLDKSLDIVKERISIRDSLY